MYISCIDEETVSLTDMAKNSFVRHASIEATFFSSIQLLLAKNIGGKPKHWGAGTRN